MQRLCSHLVFSVAPKLPESRVGPAVQYGSPHKGENVRSDANLHDVLCHPSCTDIIKSSVSLATVELSSRH